jgi:hypothetical protein
MKPDWLTWKEFGRVQRRDAAVGGFSLATNGIATMTRWRSLVWSAARGWRLIIESEVCTPEDVYAETGDRSSDQWQGNNALLNAWYRQSGRSS